MQMFSTLTFINVDRQVQYNS